MEKKTIELLAPAGSWEALEDAGLAERKPLKAWALLREVLE